MEAKVDSSPMGVGMATHITGEIFLHPALNDFFLKRALTKGRINNELHRLPNRWSRTADRLRPGAEVHQGWCRMLGLHKFWSALEITRSYFDTRSSYRTYPLGRD